MAIRIVICLLLLSSVAFGQGAGPASPHSGYHKNKMKMHNVRDYGAVGDSTTNDSSAFWGAINAMSEGDMLYVPAGKYFVGDTLYIPKNCIMQGEGDVSRIYMRDTVIANGSGVDTLSGNWVHIDSSGEVHDLYFSSADTSRIDADSTYLGAYLRFENGTSASYHDNVNVSGITGIAIIDIRNADNVKVTDCYLRGSGYHRGNAAVFLTGCDKSLIANNYFYRAGKNEIYLYNVNTNTTIRHNILEGNIPFGGHPGHSGILVSSANPDPPAGGYDIIIEHNTIFGHEVHNGIDINPHSYEDSLGITIRNNHIYGNQGAAINVIGGGVSIYGNEINNNANQGVRFSSSSADTAMTSHHNQIYDNYFYNNDTNVATSGQDIYMDQVAQTEIYGNKFRKDSAYQAHTAERSIYIIDSYDLSIFNNSFYRDSATSGAVKGFDEISYAYRTTQTRVQDSIRVFDNVGRYFQIDSLYSNVPKSFTAGIAIGAYQLPTADGTAGYQLTTDGGGGVTWVAAGGVAAGTIDSFYVVFTDSASAKNGDENIKGFITPNDTLYIDSTEYLPLTGGTMSGDIAMGDGDITGINKILADTIHYKTGGNTWMIAGRHYMESSVETGQLNLSTSGATSSINLSATGTSSDVNISAAGNIDIGDFEFTSDKMAGGDGTEDIINIDSLDVAKYTDGSIDPPDLNFVTAPAAGSDEYYVTYEHSTTNFELVAAGGSGTDDQTLAEVLAEGADANDVNITSMGEIALDLVDADGASITIGDNDETVIINSSDWDINATGVITNTAIDADNNTITNLGDGAIDDDISIDLSDSTSAAVSSDVVMDSIGGPAKFTLSHHFGSTQSACKLTGGAFTNDGGTLDVGAGSGYIKKTNHDTAATYFIDWSSQEDIETEASAALTDNAVNYIYLSYNSGTPTIFSTVTVSDIDHHTEIGLGRLYKDGTDLHLLEGGVQGQDAIYRLHKRAVNTEGFIRATGMQTTYPDSANLRIEIAAGTFWNGLTEFSFSGYESATDPFTLWWHDDGDTWQSDDTGYIPNTQYNNISGADSVLANFVNNQYGIVWVYAHIDGDIHVVYGTDSYTLSEADAATAPNSLPSTISSFSLLVAKIIIQEGEASPAEIATPWGDDISASGVTDHGGLAGLSDDDHPQYTTDANITDTLNSYADTATIKDSLDVIRGEIRDTVNATLHHWGFSIPDPNTYYDTDTIFCVVPLTSAAVTITRIDVTLDADPATEPVLTLKHKDVYIGEANVTAIDVITTAVGVTAITTGFDDATIPASKCVYLSFGADPLAAIKSINVLITYTVD